MTEDELLRELFPNALRDALMHDREVNAKKTALAVYVSSVKSMAAAFDYPVEAVAEKIALTEGITREELLEALHSGTSS